MSLGELGVSLLREIATIGGFGWVVAVVLAIVVFFRDKDLGSCRRDQVELAKSVTLITEKASASNLMVAAALESRTGVFERLDDRIRDVESEVQRLSEKSSVSVAELSKLTSAINELRLAVGKVS